MSMPFSGGVLASGARSGVSRSERNPDAMRRQREAHSLEGFPAIPPTRHGRNCHAGGPPTLQELTRAQGEGRVARLIQEILFPPRIGGAPPPDLIKNARMLCRSLQTAAAIALAIAGLAHAQEPPLPDAKQFLAESMRRLRSNDLLRSRYTFTEEETRYTYDSSGRVVKTQHRVYDIQSVVRAGVDLPPPGQRQPRPAERSGEARRRAPEEGAGMDRRAGERGAERPRGAPAQGGRRRQRRAGGGRRTDGDLRLPHDGPRDRSTGGPRSSSRSSRGRPTPRERRKAGLSRVSAGGHGSTSRITNWCG